MACEVLEKAGCLKFKRIQLRDGYGVCIQMVLQTNASPSQNLTCTSQSADLVLEVYMRVNEISPTELVQACREGIISVGEFTNMAIFHCDGEIEARMKEICKKNAD